MPDPKAHAPTKKKFPTPEEIRTALRKRLEAATNQFWVQGRPTTSSSVSYAPPTIPWKTTPTGVYPSPGGGVSASMTPTQALAPTIPWAAAPSTSSTTVANILGQVTTPENNGTPSTPPVGEGVAPFPTENPPAGYYWEYDKELNIWYPARNLPSAPGESPKDQFGRTATWDADNGEWRYPPDWGEDPEYATRKEAEDRRRWEAEFGWQQQQANQQAQMEKERHLAELRANPASWLEYASYVGQTPVIQPWMQPLMPQQYAGLGVGSSIPGYQPQGQNMALPELTPPSRQYQARMTPSAQQQYYGYEQARTGARPQDTEWRLWNQAPPGGRFGSLSWVR